MGKFIKLWRANFLLIVFIALLFSTNNLSAETIKDYFIPKYPLHIATFKMKGRNNTEVIKDVSYFKKGKFYEVRMGQKIEATVLALSLDLYKITADEVKLLKTDKVNLMGKKNETYNIPIIVLKLPHIGKSVKWTRLRPEKIHCISSFTKVIINGKKRKAIKLVKIYPSNENTGTVDFYVKGIGFCKSGILNSDGSIFKMFDLINIK